MKKLLEHLLFRKLFTDKRELIHNASKISDSIFTVNIVNAGSGSQAVDLYAIAFDGRV